MRRFLWAAAVVGALSTSVGMLSWHVSQPHGDATVASLVDGNRHAQTEQSISKQRDEYIVTIENNFSFFENERPAIHQMALRTFRPQIVGGSRASNDMLPWQVAILLRPYRWQFCGGSIISPTWVLTAAHCVDHTPFNQPQRLLVFAGSAALLSGGRSIAVTKVILHPGWNPKTNENDIALLQISPPANPAEAIATVSANEEAALTADTARGLVSGWGRTVEFGQLSKDLLFVDVPFVSRQVCNAPDSYDGAITANMLCAGEQGKDSCDGDSGGPLVAPFATPLSASATRLVGIVSFGKGCAEARKYGVYTRVRNYLDWIKTTTLANP